MKRKTTRKRKTQDVKENEIRGREGEKKRNSKKKKKESNDKT